MITQLLYNRKFLIRTVFYSVFLKLFAFFINSSSIKAQDTIPAPWMIYTVPFNINNSVSQGNIQFSKKQLKTFNNPVSGNYKTGNPINQLLQIVNTADIAITSATNTIQSENSVFISPIDKNIMLNSNNSSDWPPTQFFGTSGFNSINGGIMWSGSTAGTGGPNGGDPATVIDRNGRFYVGYIAANGGQGVAHSTDGGVTWTHVQVAPNPGNLADKNHLWVDNKTFKRDGTVNPHEGFLYSAWTDFSGVNDGKILISRSIDQGLMWTSPIPISTDVNAVVRSHGVNIQTGPDGEVYACWAIYDNFTTTDHFEIAIGFSKSLDGGQTWDVITPGVTSERIISNIKGIRNSPAFVGQDMAVCGNLTDNHIIPELGGGKYMRTNSFPVMTVNQQNGEIYIVWTNRGIPGINTGNPDIYLIKSSDKGNSWSSPIRVNQDATNDQWFPWITCDEASGALVVVYYDSRNFLSNNQVETFVSISYDSGVTWEDFLISDVPWSGDPIEGECVNPLTQFFAIGYAGDYLGVDLFHGKAVPVWSDNHSGNMLAYTQPFEFPCPQDLNLTNGGYVITDEVSFAPDANYKVTGKINVAGGVSTYKVHQGAEVLMEAATEIVLNDGFEALGEFQAIPNPTCTSFSEKWGGNNPSDNQEDNTTLEDLLENEDNKDQSKITSDGIAFSIYPNPTTGKFWLTILLKNEDDAFVYIQDIMGRTIHQSEITVPQSWFDLSLFSKGMYFVQVIRGNKFFFKKIVIQ